MKNRFYAALVLSFLLALACSPAMAQNLAKVKGKVVDPAGAPMVDAQVEFYGKDNGKKMTLKTDKKGEYFSIGVSPGVYKVTLSKDNKQIFVMDNIQISLSAPDQLNTVDINLVKEAELAKGKMTDAQKKELEKAQKEVNTVKNLNKMLAEAATAQEAGNFDQAVTILTQATQLDPTRDLLWGRLGEVQLMLAKKETDSAVRKEKYAAAASSYKKAIELLGTGGKDLANATKPTPMLGPYYNNQGEALAQTGQTEEAVKSYEMAAQVDPPKAGNYYYNLGATLFNKGKPDEALTAFDKAIAADPAKAEAYYWKANSLLAKATYTKDGKIEAAPGTVEAYKKYLELAPDGSFAANAKSTIESLGGKVDTNYKATSGKKK